MSDITYLAENVLSVIRETPEYRDYARLLKELQKDPALYARVNEMREKNFLAHQSENEDLMDFVDALTNEYDDVIAMPVVTDFIEAEAAFCKMMQEFNDTLTYGLEFD